MITLRLTKKVPKDKPEFKGGGVCFYNDKFNFGWRDKSAEDWPLGAAMQKVLVLFQRYHEKEVLIIVEKELSETRKEQHIIIKNHLIIQ